MAEPLPLCFILMPFGTKKDPSSSINIDFNAVYEKGIKPSVEAAGLEPIRADEEVIGGIIQKPMFERLLLCDYAVADLTTANANVYYELGIRHATRPATTLAIFAEGQRPLFDLNYLRCMPYALGEAGAFGLDQGASMQDKLTKRLLELQKLNHDQPPIDSPLFQLLSDFAPPDIAHLKTDVFRERVTYSEKQKQLLAQARESVDVEGVAKFEAELGSLDAVEAGVLIDLCLTWRDLSRWDNMIALYDRFPETIKRTVMMREQYGFALNRASRRTEALAVLESVVKDKGRSSETLGLVGRVYKDQWAEAQKRGDSFVARGLLDKAIAAYVGGFEADPRDAYPGINALTLLDVRGDKPSLDHKDELLPVVEFAIKQRLKGVEPSYWDYATMLELDVLNNREDQAMNHLSSALASVREKWEPETTSNNLTMIRDARKLRGITQPWLDEAINQLDKLAEQRSTLKV